MIILLHVLCGTLLQNIISMLSIEARVCRAGYQDKCTLVFHVRKHHKVQAGSILGILEKNVLYMTWDIDVLCQRTQTLQ